MQQNHNEVEDERGRLERHPYKANQRLGDWHTDNQVLCLGKSLHQENQRDASSLADANLLVQHGWVSWLRSVLKYGSCSSTLRIFA